MGPWIWDPGYGTLDMGYGTLDMGTWARISHGLGPGNTTLYPPGYTPALPRVHPPLPTHVAVHGGEAKQALLNAIAILSKLQLVDIRFTVGRVMTKRVQRRAHTRL